MAGALFRIYLEVWRAKRPRRPSDLQEAEDERRDQQAAAKVHAMAPGWYPDTQDEGVRRYFDGGAFTITERWNGTAWQRETPSS